MIRLKRTAASIFVGLAIESDSRDGIIFGAANSTGVISSVPTERMRITSAGLVAIGSSTPLANFQVTTATANATTSVQFGKANQNKGTCMTLYDAAGSPVYA